MFIFMFMHIDTCLCFTSFGGSYGLSIGQTPRLVWLESNHVANNRFLDSKFEHRNIRIYFDLAYTKPTKLRGLQF